MQRFRLYPYWVVLVLLFSCKGKEPVPLSEYTYVGITEAHWEEVITLGQTVATSSWDTTYPDKLYLLREESTPQLTFTLSPQTHACASFQDKFSFSINALDTYTANHPTTLASHTFRLSNDTLYASFTKYEGVDSNHKNFTMNFTGRILQ
jgi:hypothetical protein